jgi:hypothetical protein
LEGKRFHGSREVPMLVGTGLRIMKLSTSKVEKLCFLL